VVVIDVSQSVETDHPRALEFLRMDASNVTDFFRRAGVPVMTPRELFDFAVHAGLGTAEAEDAYVAEALVRAGERGAGVQHASAADEVAHGVFMAAYIPRDLGGVRDVEAVLPPSA
jgi:RIO kinase 1